MLLRCFDKSPVRVADMPAPIRKRRRRAKLCLEILEDRIAPANWSGTIPDGTVWSNTAIQNIVGNVDVPQGATLTIQPGTVIHFSTGTNMTVEGTLNAPGTAVSPVTFTSAQSSPAAGDWGALQFNAGSDASTLDHVVIEYGGNGLAGDVLIAAPITLSDSTIGNSASAGVAITSSNPTLTNDRFANNAKAAVDMTADSQPAITGVTLKNNGTNGALVEGGSLPANAVWNNPDIVYQLTQTVTVDSTLTVGAGQIVKAAGGSDMFIVSGTLIAQGTAAQPIIFTSPQDGSAGGDTANDASMTGTAGDWGSIQFTTGSTGSVLDYVEIRYGGGMVNGTAETAELLADGVPFTMTNSIIRDSAGAGLGVQNGAAPTVSGTLFEDNVGAAISMDLTSNPTLTGLTFVNNGTNGALLVGPTLLSLPGNTTWGNPDVVYVVPNQLIVPAQTTLTIVPGKVIKFSDPEPSQYSVLFVDGTLNASGTVDQPIVFTSLFDDTAGGDTANDGGAVRPQGGDWGGIEIEDPSSGNLLNHIDVRYGLNDLGADGVNLTVTDSSFRDAQQGGVTSGVGFGGDLATNLTITNCILADNAEFGLLASGTSATVTAANNTISGNYGGVVCGTDTTVNLTNNLITFNTNYSISDPFPKLTMSNNDIFDPTAASGIFPAIGPGHNGNIAADPVYVDAANLQFGLDEGSPAINAGTSTKAPTTDMLGNPRYNDPNVPDTGSGKIPYYDMGALERQADVPSGVALTPTLVTAPGGGVEGAKVTVSWTVTNQGVNPAVGFWSDAVYLSANPTWSPDVILLGNVTESGPVNPGQSYNASAQFVLPGVLPGAYYFLVRADADQEIVEASSDLANSTAASASTVNVDLPALTLGTPLSDQLASTGSMKLYQVTVPAGGDLAVALTGPAAAVHELYIKYGEAPSRQFFDERGITPNSANQSVSVASTQAGTYYVMVYGTTVPSAGDPFSLTASLSPFGVTAVSPTSGSNTGRTTVVISGAQLNIDSQPSLVEGGTTIAPAAVYFIDSSHLAATFDLTGQPIGAADVVVDNGGGVKATLPGALEIIAGQPGRLVTSLSLPGLVAPNSSFPIVIDYTNTGDTDLLAPVLQLNGPAATMFSLTPDFVQTSSNLRLVAVSPTGPAGILPPGASGQLTVYAQGTVAGQNSFSLTIAAYPPTPIDWPSLSAAMRPAGTSDAQWNALFPQIQADIGSSWDDYVAAISRAATLWPSRSGMNYSLPDIFQSISNEALANISTSVSGSVQDQSTGEPVANTEIDLFDTTTGVALSAVSRTDGTFLFPSVPAGTYDISSVGYAVTGPTSLVVANTSLTNVAMTAVPGAEISGGVVLAASGAPAPDVLVSAVAASGNTYVTTTDGAGAFLIDSLPAGTYDIEVGGGAYIAAQPSGVTLGEGQLQANVDFAMRVGGTISGTVSGPNGPIQGAIVSASSSSGGSSDITAADGSYTIPGLDTGSYSVTATASGQIAASVSGVAVAAGQAVTGISYMLAAGGVINGTIALAGGGAPTPMVVTATGNGTSFVASSDANGAFTLSGLPADSYVVTATASDLMTVGSNVTVVVGTPASLALTTAPLGTVGGTVTDANSGQPLASVTVSAANAQGTVRSAVTDASGNYSLAGLDAGTYRIILGDDLTPGVVQQSTSLSTAATAQTVNLACPVAGIISGTVFAADGATPVAGALVALVTAGQRILNTFTDAQGNYEFVVVAAGTYSVRATDGTAFFPGIDNLQVSGDADLTGNNFTAGTETISGAVVDSVTGAPIVGASVVIVPDDADLALPLSAQLTTGSDGRYTLSSALPGAYEVAVSAVGYGFAEQSATVSAGTPSELVFALSAGETLMGTVTDAGSGQPLQGATVLVQSAGDPLASQTAQADAEGNYQVTALASGTYTVTVLAAGEQTALFSSVAINSNQTLNVPLGTASISVSGTVTDGSAAVGGVSVTATNNAGIVVAQTVSATDGSYDLTALAAGSYSVTAAAAGVLPSAAQPITVAQGDNLSGIDLTVHAAALSDPTPNAEGASLVSVPADISTLLLLPNSPDTAAARFASLDTAVDRANAASNSIGDTEAQRSQAQIILKRLQPDFTTLQNSIDQFSNQGSDNVSVPASSAATALLNGIDNLTSGQAAADKLIVGSGFTGRADFQNTFTASFNGDPAAITRIDNSGVLTALLARLSFAGLDNPALDTAQSDVTAVQTLFSLENAVQAAATTYANDLNAFNACVANAYQAIAPSNNPATESTPVPTQIQTDDGNGNTQQGDPQSNSVIVPSGSGNGSGGQNCTPDDDTQGATTFLNQNGASGSVQPFGDLPASLHSNASSAAPDNAQPFATSRAIQQVLITQTLDSNFDLTTFQFTGFAFGNQTYAVPPGLAHYQTVIDLRPTGGNVLVAVTLDLNAATGVVTASFQALDPLTDQPPQNLTIGLPAGNNPGFVSYLVHPKANLPSGTQIHTQATITYNDDTVVQTPTAVNTLDTVPPSTAVAALPAVEPTAAFPVSWSGSDVPGGPGVGTFNVYVSDNGGPFMLWQSATSATSALYTGQDHHSYAFYSIAIDNAGLLQATAGPIQSTTVALPDRLVVNAPVQALAGGAFTISVDVTDASGVANAGYNGPAVLVLESAPTGGKLAGGLSAAIQNGVATFTNLSLSTPGSYTLFAAGNSDLLGAPVTINVIAAPHFTISVTPTAGPAASQLQVTVTALGPNDQLEANYLGTIHFASTDHAAALPADYTFQPGDAGAHTFTTVALNTPGSQTITVADTTLGTTAKTSKPVAVAALTTTATHLSASVVSPLPAAIDTGATVSIAVTPLNGQNQPASFEDVLHFTSSDKRAILPPDTIFVAGAGGAMTFPIVFRSPGKQTITITDVTRPKLTATLTLTVGMVIDHFNVSGLPSPDVGGTAHMVTITAVDIAGNTVTSYTGTAQITSDISFTPVSVTFKPSNKGVTTVPVTLTTPGPRSISVTDTNGFTGSESGITVVSPTTHLGITVTNPLGAKTSSLTAGGQLVVTVTALTPTAKTDGLFPDLLQLQSTDPNLSILSAPISAGGQEQFTISLTTAGSQTLTVSDPNRTGLTATVKITVNARPSNDLSVTGPAALLPGSIGRFLVTAEDAYHNPVGTFRDKVQLNVVGGASPAAYTFTAADGGRHTFNIALSTAGADSVTATDSGDGNLQDTAHVDVTTLTATIGGPNIGVPTQLLTFNLSANAPGVRYRIDWGDKTVQTVAGPTATHTYQATGNFTIKVAAVDPAGNVSAQVQTFNFTVAGAALETEADGSTTDLVVGCPAGAAAVTITPVDAAGTLAVTINGVLQGTFAPTGRILVYGHNGNDSIVESAATIGGATVMMTQPAVLFAGTGNSILSVAGSSTDNVLVGGGGKDVLTAGSGNDILIGGGGAATLNAGTGDDILIAGTTVYDHNLAALVAIVAEWGDPNLGYEQRVQDLFGNGTDGYNGRFLDAQTVARDTAISQLFGSSSGGLDWFWFSASAQAPDKLSGYVTGEAATFQ